MKYKTRLLKVKAIQYNGSNWGEVDKFIEEHAGNVSDWNRINLNDFIIDLIGSIEVFNEEEFNIMFERDYE